VEERTFPAASSSASFFAFSRALSSCSAAAQHADATVISHIEIIAQTQLVNLRELSMHCMAVKFILSEHLLNTAEQYYIPAVSSLLQHRAAL
jgi:hypothetical protein